MINLLIFIYNSNNNQKKMFISIINNQNIFDYLLCYNIKLKKKEKDAK
jgi:hypothetical protein